MFYLFQLLVFYQGLPQKPSQVSPIPLLGILHKCLCTCCIAYIEQRTRCYVITNSLSFDMILMHSLNLVSMLAQVTMGIVIAATRDHMSAKVGALPLHTMWYAIFPLSAL